jgi:hypothetical protein
VQNKLNKTLLGLAVIAGLTTMSVQAQPPGQREQPRTPTPRMADGVVDLGGDGVWNLSWFQNFARDGMPGYVDFDSVPFLPWTRAMYQYNADTQVKYDPQGFCLPPGGPRSMATPYPAEIIQNRDRIIIIFEGGGHVWREIHMDGRPHPAIEEINPTYFGHSVGHWEGDTLIIDTIGYNEKTWLDFGGHMHTDQLHTIEYITRPFKEVLEYRVIIDDPGAYTDTWETQWSINWSEGQELEDYICQENNKYLIDMHDDLGEPFFGRSEGL